MLLALKSTRKSRPLQRLAKLRDSNEAKPRRAQPDSLPGRKYRHKRRKLATVKQVNTVESSASGRREITTLP
jgi:hypothetical protein